MRHLGHSNFAGWQIAQAEYLARQLGTTRFVASQNHYNLLDRRAELEVLPAAQAFGLGVLPYYPLASGLLWLASRPTVASVIVGATRPEQVTQNAAAVGHRFSADDLAELDEIFPPLPPIALF